MKPMITIHSYEEHEPEFLAKVLHRAKSFVGVDRIDIHCNQRAGKMRSDPEGWCEYILVIKFVSGASLTIGCIERHVGAEMEFHS